MLSRRTAPRTRGGASIHAIVIAGPLLVLTLAGLVWPGGGEELRTEAGHSIRAVVAASTGRSDPSLGRADGYLAVGASLSPFSGEPAITRLDPEVRGALREAARDALTEGLGLRVNSGWRSARYQRELLRRAETTYGSAEVARAYVKSPEASSHVTGEAVDIGPLDAASWLSQHGSEYGLCQTYANERWHFELATTPGGTCPDMATDARFDPQRPAGR
ncbi:MAG: M15 family metallopeptidase [Solirubrobacteraceae bacterium]|nr:M15 family metallopeptidase [Solirubrobacteraceae bacterium]